MIARHWQIPDFVYDQQSWRHKWRNRFLSDGIDGLLDEKRSGRSSVINEETGKTSINTLSLTPISSSWLNAVEGWFAQLERRALYRGVFMSVTDYNQCH